MRILFVQRAFTLLELLIVVGIISILAAIAVPNFLEAQTRAKAARNLSDLHVVALGMEAYHVDARTYPPYGNPHDVPMGDNALEAYVPISLTTPVAYLPVIPVDTFAYPLQSYSAYLPIRYISRAEQLAREPDDARLAWSARLGTIFHSEDVGKEWEAFSLGPDRKDNDGALKYDPTNGTVSNGDIVQFGPE